MLSFYILFLENVNIYWHVLSPIDIGIMELYTSSFRIKSWSVYQRAKVTDPSPGNARRQGIDIHRIGPGIFRFHDQNINYHVDKSSVLMLRSVANKVCNQS